VTKPVLGKTAVYRLYDSGGALLYVGLGGDPESRWKDHAREKPWWSEVSRKTVMWHESLEEASIAEHKAIHSEKPMHNKAQWQWSRQGKGRTSLAGVSAVPLGVFRKHLPERVEAAYFTEEPTAITTNGHPRAVVVSVDWYERAVEALKNTQK
jgi:prevent-host-death family protein